MLWMLALAYASAYMVTHAPKIESYINTVRSKIESNPRAKFYINIIDEDDKSAVLDLNLRNNLLRIQDDEDAVTIFFGVDKNLDNNQAHTFYKIWGSTIEEYLLSQKDFSWETGFESKHACVFERLEENTEFVFPVALWVYCREYKIVDGKTEELSDSSVPVLLDYPKEVSALNAKLFTHQIPRDGSLYAKDIEQIFSKKVQEKIFGYSLENGMKDKMHRSMTE